MARKKDKDRDIVRLVKRMDYHTDQLAKAGDEEVSKIFRDLILDLEDKGREVVRFVKRMDYHTDQLAKAQFSDDEEVRKRFRDARLELMENIHSHEDFKAFSKFLDAAFYRLRKSGTDKKGLAVIRAVRELLKDADLDTWVFEKDKKEDE